ncbi:porin family protein [Terrimonas sp. NA20]|uniref:Porin family protein n=1 Tax=Terrimonas ginsenosidimutans TaxID=2908004 RepID=A0ABS9KT41_9BACT|nr:outer membrane beta-barrel protein [Terrimonas ginsenosidimutans]MCG2615499.1 porin family protein [Terrimonas ginsenosidimutans]
MRSYKIIMLSALLLTVAGSYAQKGEFRGTASYSAAMPLGSFKENVVSKTSFRGVDINLLYGISDKVSVGFTTGYQDFYEKYPRQVYKLSDGSDVSAVISNSVQQIPLLATARYNFMTEGAIRPYALAGIGGNLVLNRQFLGEYTNDNTSRFALSARPELGVFIPFGKESETGINVGAYYNYVRYNKGDIDNMNSVGIRLGIGFPMRN